MGTLITLSVIATLAGAALMAGVFFAFSSFIMKSLGRLPAAAGITAMQTINVVILSSSFLPVFIGTAVLSVAVLILAIVDWGAASSGWYLAGALLYLCGTFLVTGAGNVPLNNALAAESADGTQAVAVWTHYLKRWTLLNSLRTLAAGGAALALLIGLLLR